MMNSNYKAPHERVFSGIQPSGFLHIGNYLGAVKQFLELQSKFDCFFCITDMHSITVKHDPRSLSNYIYDSICLFLACGLSPEKSTIFVQSQVPTHAELTWVLSCVARIGWLNRMIQFKEKAKNNKEESSAGLYIYPVLMAADVLAYKATHIPVGEDQVQHIELIRDIAVRFNNDYDPEGFFPEPRPLVSKSARIMSLRDGSKKMSKSDISDYSRINLTDTPDLIAKKIKKAKTDGGYIPDNLNGITDRPEAKNLVSIYAAVSGLTVEQVISEFAGSPFSTFKDNLTDLLVNFIDPIRTNFVNISKDVSYVKNIAKLGANKALEASLLVMRGVYDRVGMGLASERDELNF